MYMKTRVVIQVEWAHASQYAVRARRWIDCVGRVVDATERSGDRESTLSEFRRDPISHCLGIIIFHDKLGETCARSLAGRALNCSITSVPLMAKRIFHQIDGRKIDLLLRLSSQPSTTCHAEVREGGSAVGFWIIIRSRSRSGVTSR